MPSSFAKCPSFLQPVAATRGRTSSDCRVDSTQQPVRVVHTWACMTRGRTINAAESMLQVRIASDNTNLYRSSKEISAIEGAGCIYMSQ